MEKLLEVLIELFKSFIALFSFKRSIGQQVVVKSFYDNGNGLPTGSLEIEVPDSWVDDWTIYIEFPDSTLQTIAATELISLYAKIATAHGGLPSNHNERGLLHDGSNSISPGGSDQYKRWMQVPQLGAAYHVSGKGVIVTLGLKSTASVEDGTMFAFNVYASKGSPVDRVVTEAVELLSPAEAVNIISLPRYCYGFDVEVIDGLSTFDLNNVNIIDHLTVNNLTLNRYDNGGISAPAVNILGIDKIVDSNGTIIYPGQKTRKMGLHPLAAMTKIDVVSRCNVLLTYYIKE